MLCLVAVFANPQKTPTTGIPQKFNKVFVGKIGDKYAIHMDLNRSDQNFNGSYYYDNVGSGIDVEGTIDARGKFKLTETDQSGNESASFVGTLTVSGTGELQVIKLEGTWQRKGAASPLSFVATELKFDLGMGAKIESKKINREVKKPKYTIDIEYPQVTGLVDPGQDAFNKYVDTLINKEITDFKKSIDETMEVPPDSTGSSLDINYSVEYATNKLICISILEGTYEAGAAHPNEGYITVNYDTEKHKDIKLSTLFKPNTKYLTAISRYCITQLRKTLGNDGSDWINTGAAPQADNYRAWCITDSGLLILFSPYQVASYAEGAQQVLVPYSKIADLIDPLGPVGGLVK